MKKQMLLVIGTVWLHCVAYTQGISLTAPLHILIDSAARMHHMHTKYIGIKKPDKEYFMTYDTDHSFESLLNYLSNIQAIIYTQKEDTAFIDAYYHYDIKQRSNTASKDSYIYTYYDTQRNTKAIRFNNIAPERLLDTLLIYKYPYHQNKIKYKSTYVVTGLLPLNISSLDWLFETHHWKCDYDYLEYADHDSTAIPIINTRSRYYKKKGILMK